MEQSGQFPKKRERRPGLCFQSWDVALPLFSQEELDKQAEKNKEVSKVLEELAQRKEEVETQVWDELFTRCHSSSREAVWIQSYSKWAS